MPRGRWLGIKRSDGNNDQAGQEQDQHERQQNSPLPACAREFLPYQESPKRAHHGGALADRVTNSRSDLDGLRSAGSNEVGDRPYAPDEAAKNTQGVLP